MMSPNMQIWHVAEREAALTAKAMKKPGPEPGLVRLIVASVFIGHVSSFQWHC